MGKAKRDEKARNKALQKARRQKALKKQQLTELEGQLKTAQNDLVGFDLSEDERKMLEALTDIARKQGREKELLKRMDGVKTEEDFMKVVEHFAPRPELLLNGAAITTWERQIVDLLQDMAPGWGREQELAKHLEGVTGGDLFKVIDHFTPLPEEVSGALTKKLFDLLKRRATEQGQLAEFEAEVQRILKSPEDVHAIQQMTDVLSQKYLSAKDMAAMREHGLKTRLQHVQKLKDNADKLAEIDRLAESFDPITRQKVEDLVKVASSKGTLDQLVTDVRREAERFTMVKRFKTGADNYLWCVEQAYYGAKGEIVEYGDPSQQKTAFLREARLTWALLRNARVFEVGIDLYGLFYHLADRYTDSASGGTWTPATKSAPTTADEKAHGENLMRFYEEQGPIWPFPEHLPFDNIYLAISTHNQSVSLEVNQQMMRVPPETASVWQANECKVSLLGIMITSEPRTVTEFLHVENHGTITLVDQYSNGEWHRPMSLAPWYITSMVGYLNEHSTTVLEETKLTSGQRRKFQKQAKKQRMPIAPMPYYQVRMEKKLIEDTETRYKQGARTLSYRHDVRAHEVCRVQRGPHPLEEKDREKLLKRGYNLYEATPPKEDDRRRLEIRGMKPKEPTEWLAIKTSWKEAHISPADPKLPYVPATRIPQRPRA